MGTTARVRWGRIGLGAFFAEAAVLAVFFLVLGIAQLAGVRELAAPMTPLDYAEALVFSFVSVFVFTLWVARPLDSGFVTHGVLVALVATLLFLLDLAPGTRARRSARQLRRSRKFKPSLARLPSLAT